MANSTRSTRSTAVATALPKSDERDLSLVWSGRVSLTRRILAVNIIALALLAGGFFYLDSYRSRLIDQRRGQAEREAGVIAEALSSADARERDHMIAGFTRLPAAPRIRVYAIDGRRAHDSFGTRRSYRLRDPAGEPWQRQIARLLDRVFDGITGAERLEPYREPVSDVASAWPEARAIAGAPLSHVRHAPDRTIMLSAAAAIPGGGTVMTTANARDITRTVRAERYRLGIVLALVTLVSILLSLFLARTIVRPLRRLARAAVRVRLGRARDVVVPRLPSRGDEIGMLARALSDMSQALNTRIDAIEAFAADVTHELKNPLASLRSAVESLGAVKDPALQAELLAIIDDDVRRLDRLITDVAEASRLDAQLSRAAFAPVDIGGLIEEIVQHREARGRDGGIAIAFARPRRGATTVQGDSAKLVRVIENLVDNAVSFSPRGGIVRIDATRHGDEVLMSVEDEGPGVPLESRAAIFARFHSDRPEGDGFGRHSGLGLSIAKTIIDGHGGRIAVGDARQAPRGARFVVTLPASGDAQ